MKSLGLFFTKGVSVEIWKKSGLLGREKLIYEEFIKKKIFNKIYWFTYGTNDKEYERELIKGIEIIPKPKIFFWRIGNLIYSFLLPIKQKKYLKECSFYKTNQMGGSWTAVISKFLYKKPLVLRTGYTASLFSNTKIFHYFQDILTEKISYKNADVSIVASKGDYDYIVRRYNPKKKVIIHNYVNISLFKPKKIGKKLDIVFIGRLNEQKNIRSLINAVAKTDYTLDIYGRGKLKEELEKLIKSLKKEDKIKLKGVVSNNDLPKILNQYKIYILSSLYEGMPKTLLEAMSCGLCCLGTNVSGIKEVIKHNQNGWLTGIDEENIKRSINFLMRDYKVREKLGKNARKTIEKEFSLSKVVEKEIKVYEDLLKNGDK